MIITQIAKLMGPTWDPPGSCRPQICPMSGPWILLSGNAALLTICSNGTIEIAGLYRVTVVTFKSNDVPLSTCGSHNICPLSGSHFKMRVDLFLLYNNLFIYQVLCTLIYRRRSIYSFFMSVSILAVKPLNLSALLQLQLHSRLNTWCQWIEQRQWQDETRII